jgi:tRNA-2-methylthio-N6-dimethylallyladenosine synthase
VTLLGQNVNAYGRGLASQVSFAELLHLLDGEAGVPRLRFATSHPKNFSRDLVRAIRDLPSVCEAVHLPLQSGSDAVLRHMRRGYTLEEYRGIAGALRESVPGVTLTTDIIVGFPGETGEDYRRTLSVLEELRFDAIFSFRFSPREGTAAWGMEGAVAEDEKARRLVELQALQKEITLRSNAALVGATIEVLVEGPSRRDPRAWTGRTRTNRIVNFTAGGRVAPGDTLPVHITGAGFIALAGRVPGDSWQQGDGHNAINREGG